MNLKQLIANKLRCEYATSLIGTRWFRGAKEIAFVKMHPRDQLWHMQIVGVVEKWCNSHDEAIKAIAMWYNITC